MYIPLLRELCTYIDMFSAQMSPRNCYGISTKLLFRLTNDPRLPVLVLGSAVQRGVVCVSHLAMVMVVLVVIFIMDHGQHQTHPPLQSLPVITHQSTRTLIT